jgi:PmbA protein
MVSRGIGMKAELINLGEVIMAALLKKGADGVIVIPIHTDKLMVRFSNNKVTVVQNWNVRGADVLALFGKRRIVSRFEDVSMKAIEAGVERMTKEVKSMPEVTDLPEIPAQRSFPDHFADGAIDADRISGGVESAIDSALKAGAERVSGVFTATISRDAFLGSNCVSGYDERPLYELNVRAFRGEASGQGISCATRLGGIDPEAAGGDAGRVVKLSGITATWHEGKYDVLFGPIIGANLMERVGEACSAFSVEAGMSSLAGRLGQKVISGEISMTDDGASEDALNSRSFDDEGTPTKPNVLVDRGVLISYLHNSTTAKRFNVSSTGNAGWIRPSAWSLVVGGGDFGFDELLEELKNGVFMVSNWYTRFQNYSTGDFSTISRDGAFLVKEGEVVGAIKGVRISDNLIRLFSAVDRVGSEREWIKWWEVRTPIKMPALISRQVTLTSAQGS